MENKFFTTITKKELNDEEMSLIAYANKSNVIDRSGDLITDDAWQLDNFNNNSVICAFHQYSRPPIAKALWVKVVKGEGLRMKIKFASTDEGKEFYQLYKEGILNAFSVGFRGLEYKYIEDFDQEDIEKYSVGGDIPRCVFTKVELFEVSAVAIPDNQAALVERHANGEFKTKGVEDFYLEVSKDFNLDDIEIETKEIEIDEVKTEDKALPCDNENECSGESCNMYKSCDKPVKKAEGEVLPCDNENECSGESCDMYKSCDKPIKKESQISILFKQLDELKKEVELLKLEKKEDSKLDHKELSLFEMPEIVKTYFDDLKSHFDNKIKSIETKEVVKEEPEQKSIEIDKEQLVGLVKQAILSVKKQEEIDLSQITIDALKKAKGQLF